jgi:hypothetical protein
MHMAPQACSEAGAEHPEHRPFVGPDAGRPSRWAHARTASGARVASRRVGCLEADVDAFPGLAPGRSGVRPREVLVVADQRRTVGTTVVRRALAAGMEVAHVTGKREKKARELFPGVAKNDEKDAEAIAAAAAGMPQALLPVPDERDGLEGARRLRSQLSFAIKQRTQCANRMRAAPMSLT